MNTKKNILICPLDWGLGHATRCIPLINSLKKKHHSIIIGADKKVLYLLQEEFPDLKFISFSGYEITYPKGKNMILKIAFQVPKILRKIRYEHQQLEKIIDEHKIDLVISDNRYGLWSNKVPCIFITHQVFIQTRFAKKILEKIVAHYISKFTECWIPDNEQQPFLSGNLAHKYKLNKTNYKFIGPLSRFQLENKSSTEKSASNTEYDLMAIISGPEPQRTIFEELIISHLKGTNHRAIIVRGLPSSKEELNIENPRIAVFNHLNTKDFLSYINKSKVIVSRSGYTTIMDLAILGKRAILIPTPGQTEQEYLAKYHLKQGHFYSQQQNEFDLNEALQKVEQLSPKFDQLNSLNIDQILSKN